ncbi:MAG: hypothetical protein C4332_01160 [Meiothermus sp.]
MSFKVVAVFKVAPGKVEEELRRGRLTLQVLKTQPGFIAYEAVQTGEDEVVVLQTWEAREQFQAGMAAGGKRDRTGEEDIIASRQFHAGEVVTAG